MEGRRSWDGVPVGESHSPPQSVPGRRTPLGAVGLGGFYMQGGQPPPPQHCYPTDENQPEPGTSYGQRGLGDGKSKQKMRQGKNVRLNINARERRRMHDLASALEELRRLVAYLQGTATAAGIIPPGFDLAGFPAAAKFLQQPTPGPMVPPPDPPS
ncbi:unnamed protein product [Leptidea sinapis]|uniref:BHLH domain-containing protein n=1 Tax=Leptidea sinapis TaxID=189913 RepID=A0A5E4R317_9NEOP|nr:unnamed protein product [Leptidea sinapis]